MKLGVFGGTFDPIHNGHLAVADEVREELNMDRVLFVPTGQPWLKSDRPITAAKHRVEMVRLAITGRAYCQMSMIEIERKGPSYTLDTMAELWKRLGDGDEQFFIMGWGSLNELPQWREPERIIRLCRLVAVPRLGYPRPDLKSLEKSIPGISQRVIILERPQVDISASDIRERVSRGLSISGLVPEAVERYIREGGLYKTGS
jgi:nicotinate-nucleotide adenylyltransferase